MDFKGASTKDGHTARQREIKVAGITGEIMAQALTQAKTARLGILEQMVQVLPTPRSQLSPFAPRISTIKINPDKIREVIGKGGATIQRSEEDTSELQSLMRIPYAVFCLKKKKQTRSRTLP